MRGATRAITWHGSPGTWWAEAMDGFNEEQRQALLNTMPYGALLGIELLEASPERVTGRLQHQDKLTTLGGIMHGGVLMSLADTLGGICAFLNLPEGAAGTTTIESKTNLMRGVPTGAVQGVTVPLHVGRTSAVVETRLTNEAGKLVSLTIQTQTVIWPRSQ